MLCLVIEFMIYHDVIMLTLPSVTYVTRHSYRSEKGRILNFSFYILCNLLSIVLLIHYVYHNHVIYVHVHSPLNVLN